MEPKKKCLTCDEPIKGRRDKVFCSDQCRVAHWNEQNRDVSKFMTNINNYLRRNRRILAQLNPNGKAKVTKAELLDEGFKFSYFTNEFVTKTGKVYRFCYDQGYLEIEENVFALVVRHEYVV